MSTVEKGITSAALLAATHDPAIFSSCTADKSSIIAATELFAQCSFG